VLTFDRYHAKAVALLFARRVVSSTAEPYRLVPKHTWSQHGGPVTDLHVGHGGPRARVLSVGDDHTCKVSRAAAAKHEPARLGRSLQMCARRDTKDVCQKRYEMVP